MNARLVEDKTRADSHRVQRFWITNDNEIANVEVKS
jgi:hypothetical protein